MIAASYQDHRPSAPPDQAAGLRHLVARRGLRVLPVFGGAERLPAAIHLSAAAAAAGARVILLDASRGEAAPALGLAARWELKHLLDGEKTIEEVALRAACGVRVVPAGRGIDMLAAVGGQGDGLFGAFARLAEPADLVVVNAPEARAAAVLPAMPGDALIALSPSSASLTDAWAVAKALCLRYGAARFRTLVLHADAATAARVRERFAAHLGARLGAAVAAGGAIPADPALRAAAVARRSLAEIDPRAPAARAFANAAAAVDGWSLAEPQLAAEAAN